MRIFQKKTMPETTAPTGEPSPTQDVEPSRFSFRRTASSQPVAATEAESESPPESYKTMEEANKSSIIELPQKNQDVKQQETQKVADESSVATEIHEERSLSWSTFCCLSIWCAVPCAVYILLFTQMGFGESFYYALSNQFGFLSLHLSGIILVSTFLYYILDIDEWSSSTFGKIMRFVLTFGLFALFIMWVLLVSNELPYGIISLFAIVNPLWLLMVKNIVYGKMDTRVFMGWLSGPLLLLTFVTAVVFVVWVSVSPHNQWNEVTMIEAAERTGCEADFEEYPGCYSNVTNSTEETCFYLDDNALVFQEGCEKACLGVYSGCSNGLILWAGPLLMCLSMMFLGLFCRFLRTESRSEQDILNYAKIWIVALGISWVSASLAGTAADATSSLMALTLASLVAASIILTATFSKNERKSNKEAILTSIREKYGDSLDVARGLFVVTCSPLIIVYLLLSMTNQLVRRIGLPISQPAYTAEDSTKNSSLFTVRTNKHLTRMRSWDRTRVFTYAVYWGIAYMILQVIVSKITVVFLSWMIEKTAELGLYATTAIMCGVGVTMFLLPPVPGVPVYLTLGIVLTARGYETLGWVYCVLYSTAVGTGLKLFSSAMQQKLIGENLSRFVQIRQFVGINSKLMRAMRLVVGQRGICVAKVAVLIGGPDWPTSVLCGIMRLSLIQIMIGTLPIVALIFPTALMGGLIYMSSLDSETGNPEVPWAGTAATICASVTAFVQFGSMIVAAYYLEKTAEESQVEIDAIEIDEEVKEADERDEHLKKCYSSATQWRSISMLAKTTLVSAVVSVTTSCYLVQFFSSLCFVPHELTDTIEENLGGSALNLFLPVGWAAIGLFTASIILLRIFIRWGKIKANDLVNVDNATPILN